MRDGMDVWGRTGGEEGSQEAVALDAAGRFYAGNLRP